MNIVKMIMVMNVKSTRINVWYCWNLIDSCCWRESFI